jgi:hypothetical protein
MIKRVTAFITSDGQIFEKIDEATANETTLLRRRALGDFVEEKVDNLTHAGLVKTLLENREQVISALSTIAEIEPFLDPAREMQAIIHTAFFNEVRNALRAQDPAQRNQRIEQAVLDYQNRPRAGVARLPQPAPMPLGEAKA